MTHVTTYQISAIKLLRKMRRKISWTDGQTDRGKTVYPSLPSGSGGIIITKLRRKEFRFMFNIYALLKGVDLGNPKIFPQFNFF